jgi:predicted dehydrogenase
VRGVVLGFGTIALGHMTGYSRVDDLSIAAVVDPVRQRRELAEHHHGLHAYPSFDLMMDNEHPDFIDICAPPHTHTEYIRLGLRNGMHVLCEKPVIVPEEGRYDPILADILDSSAVFYPCHNYKFAPVLKLMEDAVRSGDFGNVLSARFRTLRSGHAVGVPEWKPHWRRDPAISGGGILRDHGPHSIYLATHLTAGVPISVSCLTGNLLRGGYADTEDTALLTIRCEDDIHIVLDLSWAANFRSSYYSVIGTLGTMVVENDDVAYTVAGETVRKVLPSDFDDPSHKEWFRLMFHDFLDMVAHPQRQDPLLREALMTSLVIDGAYRSAESGGSWIDLEDRHLSARSGAAAAAAQRTT